jgi:hypothetical protein
MKPFQTDKGGHVHLFPITITLGSSAMFKCIIYIKDECYHRTYNLEGDDYKNWGSDDDYIKKYICKQEPYLGNPLPDYKPPAGATGIYVSTVPIPVYTPTLPGHTGPN